MRNDVFVARVAPRYPAFPYSPDPDVRVGLQALFEMWDLDPTNPFEEWLAPGARVVLKPNWVLHQSHGEPGEDLDALVTHTSIIRHLIDFIAMGLRGRGTVLIGDAPLQECDFNALLKRARISDMVRDAARRHPGLHIEVQDWRLTVFNGDGGAQRPRADYETRLARDYRIVDLGQSSFLEDISDRADRFRVTCYDPRLMAAHHRAGKHEYLISNAVFDADLLINLPKMKTHIKAGLTGALKNLIGINGHKEFLPHHIRGGRDAGGDCYPRGNRLRSLHDIAYDGFWSRYAGLSPLLRRAGFLMMGGLWRAARILDGETVDAGSWIGNDTIWRTTLDLNHALYFSAHAPRRVISIVDGVIAGEGEGPLSPVPRHAGLLIGGENPAGIDATLGRLMGYDVSQLPTVHHALTDPRSRFGGCPAGELTVRVSDGDRADVIPFDELPNLEFAKPPHWRSAEGVPVS